MDWLTAINTAAERIADHIRCTPAVCVPELGADMDTNVWLKLENHQLTGSFKARGGANKILCLSTEQRNRGVVTASSGNHGAGTAHAAAQAGVALTVFVPLHTHADSIDRIAKLGATVTKFGEDCVETERHARAVAKKHDQVYVSPYNDPMVVAGQGTIAVELHRQVPNLDAVFVAMGGGGLISGIGSYLKRVRSRVEVVGCSPAASPAMHVCLATGRIIDVDCTDTLSVATAGGIEAGSITFELCKQVVDRSLLVDEDAIRQAIRLIHTCLDERIEGAAGVAVAAWMQVAHEYAGKNVAIIVCGGNISNTEWQEVIRT